MSRRIPQNRPTGAVAILSVMFVSVFVLAIAGTVAITAQANLRLNRDAASSEQTFYAAEAGINEGLYELITFPNPHTSSYTVGGVDVAVAVEPYVNPADPEAPFQRLVRSTASDVTGKVRTLSIVAKTSAFAAPLNYAVLSGRGGLILKNGATVNGPIYANGNIVGDHTSQINGDVWVAQGTLLQDDPSQLTGSTPLVVAKNAASANAAERFTVNTEEPLTRISVWLRRTGTLPDANYRFRVVEDDSGKPGPSVVAEASIQRNSIPTTAQWVDFTFDPGPLLTPGTPYWMLFDTPSTHPSKYLEWGMSTDPASYGNGEAMVYDATASAWTPVTGDLAFRTAFGTGNTWIKDGAVEGNVAAHLIDSVDITGTATCQQRLPPSASCVAGLDPGTVGYEISDVTIDTWKTQASAGTVFPGTHTVTGSENLGPARIDGDLILDSSSAAVTLQGNVYVTGDIRFTDPNSSLSLDSSLGPDSKVVIADGEIDLKNGAAIDGSGDPASFVMMISQSHHVTLADPAIYAKANTDAVLFFAPKGMVRLWNGSSLTGTTGYVVYLEQNSTITYDPAIQGFTVTPSESDPIVTLVNSWVEE